MQLKLICQAELSFMSYSVINSLYSFFIYDEENIGRGEGKERVGKTLGDRERSEIKCSLVRAIDIYH